MLGAPWWESDWTPGPAQLARWFRYKVPQRRTDGIEQIPRGVPALCEFWNVPYTGSDPLTLALCLDKARAKAHRHGLSKAWATPEEAKRTPPRPKTHKTMPFLLPNWALNPLTAKIFKRGFRVYEVPITYAGRGYDEGKKITWRDGFAALYALVKYRFVA